VRNLEAMRALDRTDSRAFGHIDVLINNASPWLMRPFLDVTEAEYDLCNDVTVKAAFFCTQAVAPFMLQQGRGVIINVADLSVYEVWPGLGHHAIAKAGVVQLTRYAARELSPAIRVNAVAPGPVLLPPDFTAEQIEDARQHTLVKRLGAPEDVSRMIALC
jgi:pteridine reductase